MNVNVINERNPGRVATFQGKIHHLPPKLPTSDCCPGSKCAVDQPKKTLEERASGSFKQEVPNFRFGVEGVSLNQVSTKNQFPIHTFNCCSGPDCETKTYNELSKKLEDLASTPIKLPEPNFINVVEELTLRSSSTKPKDCCEECRGPQGSSSSATHGNLNNSTGAPISSSTRKPLDGEQLGFNEFEGGNLKNGSVDPAIQIEPVVKQSCCVIS